MLHHYTLPQWLAEKGGWEFARIEHYFARFVKRVMVEYGQLVRYWITLNEPVVHVFKSYLIGQWPPGKQDWPAALKVLRHMLRAHVRAYHIIHRERPDANDVMSLSQLMNRVHAEAWESQVARVGANDSATILCSVDVDSKCVELCRSTHVSLLNDASTLATNAGAEGSRRVRMIGTQGAFRNGR